MTQYPYESHVQPHLSRIVEYVGKGYSASKVAALLGIPFRLYQAMTLTYAELADHIDLGKQILLGELEYSMYERARGILIEERKVVETVEHGVKNVATTITSKFVYSDKLMITALKRLDPRVYGSLTLDNMTSEEKMAALINAVKTLPDDLLEQFYEGLRSEAATQEVGDVKDEEDTEEQ